LEFALGEWLLSSYIATGIENVPIFIRADNSENEIALLRKSLNVFNTQVESSASKTNDITK
jgi:hypothetical protein